MFPRVERGNKGKCYTRGCSSFRLPIQSKIAPSSPNITTDVICETFTSGLFALFRRGMHAFHDLRRYLHAGNFIVQEFGVTK